MRAFPCAIAVGFVFATVSPVLGSSCDTTDPTTATAVASARSTADQECHDDGRGCDNAPSHGAYVSCIAHKVNDLASGPTPSLPPSCKGFVKRCASRSTCGKQDRGFVTCYRTDSAGATKCSTKSDSSLCSDPPGGSHCV